MKKEILPKKWEGTMAPLFELPDQSGNLHSLLQYRGKKVLLYFYPKDMTHGCTLEAQGFRDHKKEYQSAGIVILGISADSVASHKKFCEKEALTFPLLSDERKDVVRKYGVWKEKMMYGRKYMGVARESFLIDEKGTVIKHYGKVDPIAHPLEVLNDIKSI